MATSASGQIYSISCFGMPPEQSLAGVMPEVGVQEVLQLHDPVTGDVITSIALMINGPDEVVIDIHARELFVLQNSPRFQYY